MIALGWQASAQSAWAAPAVQTRAIQSATIDEKHPCSSMDRMMHGQGARAWCMHLPGLSFHGSSQGHLIAWIAVRAGTEQATHTVESDWSCSDVPQAKATLTSRRSLPNIKVSLVSIVLVTLDCLK